MSSSTGLALNSNELPALAKPTPMTASLAYHVAGDAVINGHYTATVGQPSAADVGEAKRRLQEAEHLCRPPPPRLIAAWCAKLRTLPKAPPNDEAIAAALVGIVTACADLPAAVFTAETAKQALQRFKWWPGPAEIYELLSTQADPYRRVLRGLKRVLATSGVAPVAPKEGITPEAEAHVAAVVKAFVVERSWNQPGAVGPNARAVVKSLLAPPAALIAEYEKAVKDGHPEFAALAQTRLEMLYAKYNRSQPDGEDL